MLGKIAPYVAVGGLQMSVDPRGGAGSCSTCRSSAAWRCSSALTLLFIVAKLSVGYTFSTVATTQLQAMQMSFFFFLPNILLSGFMFPFRGMPGWAQVSARSCR